MVTPREYPVGTPIDHDKYEVVLPEHAHTGTRLVALDGVVAEVGIDLNLIDAADNL